MASRGNTVASASRNQPVAATPGPIRALFHRANRSRFITRLRSDNGAVAAVAAIALILSLLSFAYFFSQGMTNVYGDGVAHVNIARKVVDHPDDSLWQRYVQIGSPWLPLQTVLMLPLVANDWMWQTGAAGSLISMLAFVTTAVALYLLARHFYRSEEGWHRSALPVISAAIFLLNPSALYMQSTPMTELIFMAALTVAAYLLQRWMIAQTSRRLVAAAAAVSLAALARYEAWPVAALACLVVLIACSGDKSRRLKTAAAFSAIAATGPAYWLWHNRAIYDDALWFLTGPYSARGLYLQNQANLGWARIFVGNAMVDILLMWVTVAVCVGPLLMLMAALGFFRRAFTKRRALLEDAPALLLCVPFLFHVFSLYRGEIQIFPLSAFGLHNVRYGLPHLLAVALFAPASVALLKRAGRRWAVAIACAAVALQYGYLLSEGPRQLEVYQEGFRNGVNAKPARARARVSTKLRESPPAPLVLMHTGALGPVVSQSGLHFSSIIHEGTMGWHQISDDIPDEVSTIIFQEGDPLGERLRANQGLARELEQEFQQQFSVDNIRVFKRRAAIKVRSHIDFSEGAAHQCAHAVAPGGFGKIHSAVGHLYQLIF
jgi:hypothetical protein